MGWLTPKAMERRPGTPGVVVVLVDVTGSISPVNKQRIGAEVLKITQNMPSARVLAFGTSVMDITHDPSEVTRHTLWGCFEGANWGNEKDFWRSKGNEGTYAGKALAAAAALNPERTMVLSDGGAADRGLMLRTADQMTGQIDAYYCHPVRGEFLLENHFISADDLWKFYSRGADKSAMQELARRGGGRCFDYPTSGIYTDFGIRDAQPMSHQRKVFIGGPTVNVAAPQTSVQTVYRDTHINVIDRLHYHYGQVEEIHSGEDRAVDVELGQSQVNVSRPDGFHAVEHHAPEPPRSLLKTILLGPSRSQYRGELKAAQSLPAPTEQPVQQIAYFSKLPTKVR